MHKNKAVLALILTVLMLAGCASPAPSASSAAPAASSAASSVASSAAPVAPGPPALRAPGYPVEKLSETPITISIFACKQNANVAPYDEIEYLNEYCKATNINVEWENVAIQQQDDRFNVIVASNTLPDMFWAINPKNFLVLRSNKVAKDLRDILNEENAPNYTQFVKENPSVLKYYVDPDGSMFHMPNFETLTSNSPTIVRKDWLDKLGLPVPETKEDWYKYWVGVRDNDMNGNGDMKDEIPLSFPDANSTNVGNGIRTWVSGFGMFDRFYIDPADGDVIKFANNQPAYKEFLEWCNMLWNENLIDKEFASINQDNFNTKNAQNLVGSYRGKLNSNLNTYMTTIANNIPGYDLLGTPPMKTGSGLQLNPGVNSLVKSADFIGGVVTVQSKYPVECVQFSDWFYDYTPRTGGGFLGQFGKEGKTFEMTPDGKDYNYTDYVLKNPDGLSAQGALYPYSMRNQSPGLSTKFASFKMWHPSTIASYANIEPFYDKSLSYIVQTLPFSDDDTKLIKSRMSEIDTYIDETINKFIMGTEPIANFDKYVETIKGMGIDEVLEVYNKAYKAWNS